MRTQTVIRDYPEILGLSRELVAAKELLAETVRDLAETNAKLRMSESCNRALKIAVDELQRVVLDVCHEREMPDAFGVSH